MIFFEGSNGFHVSFIAFKSNIYCIFRFGLSRISTIEHTGSQFHLLGNPHTHSPYTHHQELHSWFNVILRSNVPSSLMDDYLLGQPPPPMLIIHKPMSYMIQQVTHTFNQFLFHFLTCAEWKSTLIDTPTTPLPTPTGTNGFL